MSKLLKPGGSHHATCNEEAALYCSSCPQARLSSFVSGSHVQLAWCLVLPIEQFCFVIRLNTTVRTACQCRPQLALGSRQDCF